MAALKEGDRVEHQNDASLGVGVVRFVEEIAGGRSAYVLWGGATDIVKYTEAQLRVVEDLAGQLASVGPGATVPFQLRVLGRWFKTRHEQTGEITNQPFDMLPHQVVVTNRVLTSPPAKDGGRHWLIADDVGLGKTIEAGMILEVMRHRAGGALRCLVVAPAGLVRQWQDELEERFGRRFERFERDDVNKLQTFDQVVASIHTLKLLLRNKAALDVHPWDLVIFDEAHHLTRQSVQMYDLARHLRENKKSKNTLFLTATPHSGNHDHFCNLLHLLRPDLVDRAEQGLEGPPGLATREDDHPEPEAPGDGREGQQDLPRHREGDDPRVPAHGGRGRVRRGGEELPEARLRRGRQARQAGAVGGGLLDGHLWETRLVVARGPEVGAPASGRRAAGNGK